MSYWNDAIEGAMGRLHGLLYNTTVDLYEPEESYSNDGSGFSVTYPGSATEAGIKARAESPSADPIRLQSGTEDEIDRVYLVRDDARSSWTGFGAGSDAPARIEDTETGDRYEVRSATDHRDGLTQLECVEV